MPRRDSNDSEKKHVAYGLVSDYSVRRTSGGTICGPKFITWPGKVWFSDILTSPEVIRAQELHFKPNFKFSPLIFFFGGGTPVPVAVCGIRPWSISSACKNLKEQHPLRAEM